MKNIILTGVVSILALAACSNSRMAEKAAAARPDGQGSVEVSIEGVGAGEGAVYGSIYLTTDGFPGDKKQAYTFESAEAASAIDGKLVLNFSSIPAGWFVVAVLHDEDGNEELSMNVIGAPKEDYGFSRNPDSLFGPPAFDDAAVYLEAGENKQLVISID